MLKKMTCLGVLGVAGLLASNASAAVYLYDNFESQPLTNPTPPGQALQPPLVGVEYSYAATTQVDAVNVVEAPLPTIGNRSLEVVRTATQNANLSIASNAGTLIDGNVLEIKWSHQLSGGTGHRFNGPMQVSIGYSNGMIGNLAFISINDANSGTYHYSDAYIGNRSTGLQPSLNAWDHLRVVMTLDAYDATYMTGKYDLYISIDGAPEVKVANQADLSFALIATASDAENDPTSAWFRIQKGPSTSNSYYDNISITDYGTEVPEPASAAMIGIVTGFLALRRRTN